MSIVASYKKLKQKYSKQGFTLIELLVVVAIIGLLSSIVMIAYRTAQQKAQEVKWESDASQIQTAYELFYADNNYYPYAAGDLPVEALAPYSKVTATQLTQGVGSYFAFSREETDPNIAAISDDGSGCIRIHNGYIIAIGSETPNAFTMGDGGIEPSYYERFGGDYKMYHAAPGTYSGGNICPDY
jgi:prepilin-type N-terminal cleavage/methylation domain-containing protein